MGSVGSCTDPPMLSLTPRWVSSSTMSRASGKDRASRSSLVTTSVSPVRHAARASRSPGRARFLLRDDWVATRWRTLQRPANRDIIGVWR